MLHSVAMLGADYNAYQLPADLQGGPYGRRSSVVPLAFQGGPYGVHSSVMPMSGGPYGRGGSVMPAGLGRSDLEDFAADAQADISDAGNPGGGKWMEILEELLKSAPALAIAWLENEKAKADSKTANKLSNLQSDIEGGASPNDVLNNARSMFSDMAPWLIGGGIAVGAIVFMAMSARSRRRRR